MCPTAVSALDLVCKDCSGNVAFDEQEQGCPIVDHGIHVDAGEQTWGSERSVALTMLPETW